MTSNAGMSGIAKGYSIGGNGPVTRIEDLNFLNEISATIAATLDVAKILGAAVSGSRRGYYMGGDTGARVNTIENFVFVLETSNTISAVLDAAKSSSCGVYYR
jgi:transcription elongation factor